MVLFHRLQILHKISGDFSLSFCIGPHCGCKSISDEKPIIKRNQHKPQVPFSSRLSFKLVSVIHALKHKMEFLLQAENSFKETPSEQLLSFDSSETSDSFTDPVPHP
ncbi:hypothetical protein Nepgr_001568 [Nepenthes gracilis]|uniref:Uncharacterized protein n=1 Tax=Nepenthes gracilis TaxID=150966 RepID=A0AAD3P4N6_NEPGR|nr:hypothetical protein Nepgr_001568 [Nepenthes gracilis]